MSFTYGANPLLSSLDAVRMLIRDTDMNRALFQDEEIEFFLANEANIWMAAAGACKTLIFRSGGVSRKKVGELMIDYDHKFYVVAAAKLEARGMNYQMPYVGGISKADKLAQQGDIDWVEPSIMRNLGDNPAAPKPTTPPVNPLDTI